MGITYNKSIAIGVKDVATLKAGGRVEIDGFYLVAGIGNSKSLWKLCLVISIICTDDTAVLWFQPCPLQDFCYGYY